MYIQSCDYCGARERVRWYRDDAVCDRCVESGVYAAVAYFGGYERAKSYARFPHHRYYSGRSETIEALLSTRYRPVRRPPEQDALF